MSTRPNTSLALDATESAFDAAFADLTLRRGLVHERGHRWPTAITGIPRLGEVVASRDADHFCEQVIERDGGALHVRLDDGWATVTAAAAGREPLGELVSVLRHALPPLRRAPEEEEREVAISFWAMGPRAPFETVRRLPVPAWDELAPNYPRAVAAALGGLMERRPPLPGGRLVLWHGPPGSGKTYALRALAWEWRRAVDVQYIVDPEAFLSEPGYLMRVLLGTERGPWEEPVDEDPDRWRLIVMEDAGELLAPDAKLVAGQGLARLLNLTDGLMGQARNALVLITGNEPLERLHPAVSRAGRCAERVAFAPFSPGEAADWLRARGASPTAAGAATLADLYARLEGRAVGLPGRSVGFAA